MKIQDITSLLEKAAPVSLQETYDNAGLITGNPTWECNGVLISLDATEEVIEEAVSKKCNLVIAHHPIVFKGLKRITGKNYVERAIITAIKNDIAIYAIHTNLDNVINGVNGMIADKIGLINRSVLMAKEQLLQKLVVYVPVAGKDHLLDALFKAGAGNIGQYSECSFSGTGTGSFKGGTESNPYVGKPGERHYENEERVEVIFPAWIRKQVIAAMKSAHPYEEVAFDLYSLENGYELTGSGLVAELEVEMDERSFLEMLKNTFNIPLIRHTAFTGRKVKKVALCGGAGSFLTGTAIASGADAYITADIKYHEFFDADGRLLLADIGHYESEQFTIDLLFDLIRKNFPKFAVLKSGRNTNPVNYF